MPRLPENITIPNSNCYQVRITRNRQEHSKSFAWSHYPNKREALKAAVSWRNEMRKLLGNKAGHSLRAKPMPFKQSWNRVGVTRYIKTDQRRPGAPQYIVFGVNFVDARGVRRVKQFHVGPLPVSPGEEDRAAHTADAFRSDYEWCRLHERRFNPDKYRRWKLQPMFPFQPPV